MLSKYYEVKSKSNAVPIANLSELAMSAACSRGESNRPHLVTPEISLINSDHTRRNESGHEASNQFALIKSSSKTIVFGS